ncbi:phosphocholine cytidylyltransferase family protein [Desulfobacula phenolica]|uniref:Nucleotidyl transferase n=1 Tax=Desulfobacula phenolica TaxID=90732 RepID=A0A1H2IFL3_9BACT|nr:phosphocholine cytidylyltransferase family protein [Desulfobacula phenolica]SDU42917.1 Nucleotidyl transferase [Desulfobacula phenolica]
MIEQKNYYKQKKRITTALLLAAGTGSRLLPLTKSSPKCMTMVNELSILERLIKNLNQNGFKRLVVVTGHLEDCIRNFLEDRAGNLKIEYVFSPLYKTTNNIYSLWMARKTINEPFMLIESDLVFDTLLLKDMLYPDRIAVASIKPWLNGSTVTLDQSNHVDAFHSSTVASSNKTKYKTVNIYSLSLASWDRVVHMLNQYILAGRVNDYYEAVFEKMVAKNQLSLKAVFFDGKPWYEVDTIDDLTIAEQLFPSQVNQKPYFGDINTDDLIIPLLPACKSTLKGQFSATSRL